MLTKILAGLKGLFFPPTPSIAEVLDRRSAEAAIQLVDAREAKAYADAMLVYHGARVALLAESMPIERLDFAQFGIPHAHKREGHPEPRGVLTEVQP